MPDDHPLTLEQVLAEEYAALRPTEQEPLTALCLSGGGIRSATFSLGAIQGLAEQGLLEQFDYLSTVSGGGYIGGWLTAWKGRAGGLASVVERLRRNAPPAAEGEADPIQHLREYNNYLSPRAGGFSSDLWTMVATVVRNVLLNWMVLIPLLMFVLMVPRLFVSLQAFPEYFYGRAIFTTEGVNYAALELNSVSHSPLVKWGLPGASLLLFACALFFTLRYLPGIGNRDHTSLDYHLKILAPLVGAVLAFLTFNSLYYLGDLFTDEGAVRRMVAGMLLPCAAAWAMFILVSEGSLRDRVRLALSPLSLSIAAMAVGTGLATWLVTNKLLYSADASADISWATYVTLSPPVVLAGFVLSTVLFVGLSSAVLKDDDREWMSRAAAGGLVFGVVWTGVCGLVLILPNWLLQWPAWAHVALAAATAASAWLSTQGEPAAANANPGAGNRHRPSLLRALAPQFGPVFFFALLVAGLSAVTNLTLYEAHVLTGTALTGPSGETVQWLDHNAMLTRSHPALVVLVTLVFLGVALLMSRYININSFSLHAMYRARLVRAYLGASNPRRHASPFTGFSRSDDMPMGTLDPVSRPLQVVNLTLNLVATSRLAWQQRKADSFTVSALHSGNSGLGYRRSAEYAGGISLGTAIALSGAAASSSMGAFSKPVVAFIMTLFNTRLGAWLGNPGKRGARTWQMTGPRFAIGSMIKEALGQTSEESTFVYLSDGGHFENLGLYEMVRRRCRHIVVLDAGCDPEFRFDDLGNALRKIRIDLRVPIEFDDQEMQLLRAHRRRCAVGRIRYSVVDEAREDGHLVYVKPLLRGNEAPDVTSYAAGNPTFPHQSTADQWFDESQTESYRSLGLTTIDEICRGWTRGSLREVPPGSLAEFCAHVEKTYLAPD